MIEFEFAPGKDARPDVAKLVIDEGYDLLELRPLGLSLEEIFLELTGTDSRTKGSRQ
jgi:ABC-2 type transport system ATP-binding protein